MGFGGCGLIFHGAKDGDFDFRLTIKGFQIDGVALSGFDGQIAWFRSGFLGIFSFVGVDAALGQQRYDKISEGCFFREKNLLLNKI